MPIIRV